MIRNSKNFFLTVLIVLTSLYLHAAPFDSLETLRQFLQNQKNDRGQAALIAFTDEHGVPLYQLRVLPQGSSYCGYHATKNILLTKDFINNPTAENLRKLQSQQEYRTKWNQWNTDLRRSTRTVERMNVRKRFIASESTYRTRGVMESIFLHDMLRGEESARQKIEAQDSWTEHTFSNFFESNLILENIVKINEQFSRLQLQNDYYGIAFGMEKIGGHWISIVFVKKNDRKYVFCFDSVGNRNQLNFPTVQFLTDAFASNEENAFIKKYLTAAIPAIIAGLNSFNTRQERDRDKLIKFITSNNTAIKTLSEGLREDANTLLQQKINALLAENRLGQQLLQAIRDLKDKFNHDSWKIYRRTKLTSKFLPELKTPGELRNIITNDYIPIINGNHPASYTPSPGSSYTFPRADTFASTLVDSFLNSKIAQSLPLNTFLQIHPLIHDAVNDIFVYDSIHDLPRENKTNIRNKLREIREKLEEVHEQRTSDLAEELRDYYIPIIHGAPLSPAASLFRSNLTIFLNDKIQPDIPNDTFPNIQTNVNEITNLLSSSGDTRINQLAQNTQSQLTTRLERIEQALNNLQNFKAHQLREELRTRFINVFNANQPTPSLNKYFSQIKGFFNEIQNSVSSETYNDNFFEKIFDAKDLLNPHGNTKIHQLSETIKRNVKTKLREIDTILRRARQQSTSETEREIDRKIQQKLRSLKKVAFESLEQLEQILAPRFGTQQPPTPPQPQPSPPQPQQFEQSVNQLTTSLQQLQEKLQNLGGELETTQKTLSSKQPSTQKLVSTRLIGDDLTINQNDGIKRHSQHAGKKKINNTWFYDVQVLTQCPDKIRVQTKKKRIRGYNKGEEKFRNQFGCGFHALKNVLFMTKMVLDPQFIDPGQVSLNSVQTFLHYFEAPSPLWEDRPLPRIPLDWKYKWAHDIGNTSWYFLWKQNRQSKNIPHDLLDDPPTQDYDLEHLKQKIIDKEALAPDWAADIIKNTTTVEYIDGENLTQTTPQDVLKLLRLAKEFERNESIVLPFLIGYSHAFRQSEQETNPNVYGTTGRHWITVIINKYQGNTEVLFADSWRWADYMPKNFSSTKTLLNWLTKPQETVERYVVTIGKTKKARYETVTDEQLETFEKEVNKIYPNTFYSN